MSLNYEELDYRPTPLGGLLLRRRRMVQFGDLDIYEIKLGDDFLMTSLFHESEDQLAKIGLSALKSNDLNIVVGGLGLGYTAVSALEDSRVSSMVVIDYLKGVIDWHKNGLLPMGKILNNDSRCKMRHADFFALSKDSGKSYDPDHPTRKHDAILLDIDHTPTHVLHPTNSHLYSETGLRELATHLNPGGVFALWSDGRPDKAFTKHLTKVFSSAESHTIEFANPLSNENSVGTVYVARTTV